MEKPIIFSRPHTARMREALSKTMEKIEKKKIKKEKEERQRLHNKIRPLTGQKDLILNKIKRKIDDILNNKQFKKIQMEEKKMELRKVKLLGKIVNLLEHSIVLSPEDLLYYKIEFKFDKTKKKIKTKNKNKNQIKQMKFSHNLNYFSDIGITFRYEDVYYTPTEFIQKNFTDSEKRLMVLDPKYFLLHKPPFDSVDLKLKYSLTSKIQEEEDKIKLFEKKNEIKKNEIKKHYSIENRKTSIFYPVFNNRNEFKNNYLTLETDLSSDINNYKNNNIKNSNRILTASTRPITASNNINNINRINLFKNSENDENNIFKNKINKTFKFLYVPKTNKKKKKENRTFEDFERRKKLIQDERQYFRRKKVNDYKELKERNRTEILKELERKKEIRNIITQIENNYFESNHMK